MSSLPTGTVTFLFTDIEGSTRLIERLGNQYAQILSESRRLLREAFQERGGHEVDARGEEFFVAFSRARDAVAAAVAGQRVIATHPWPEGISVEIRMGLHTGEPIGAETGYVGMDVHRAARICSAGHGGQILLSDTTQALVAKELPEGVSLRDLGEHRLKDLAQPQRLFQVIMADLPTDFPPLKSLNILPNNLPIQLTSFVGREREIGDVKTILANARLLTLTGAGGSGKTRLALQVCADLLDQYPDGVWLIDLAALSDSVLVPQTVASALRVTEEPGRMLMETLVDSLRPKSLLLLLDNCEHLLTACARLADGLLRACPNLRILATSREGLGIAGEMLYPVPTLSSPDPQGLPPTEDLTRYEAVRLFNVRAMAVMPTFGVSSKNDRSVAQICHQLDGIPLAIELAAVRVKALTVEQIAQRLDDRFSLLTAGSRTALPRHQTLRAAMNWSYDLVSGKERMLLRRLSVFVGGFTLEAAEEVCAWEGIAGAEVLELLAQLVDKSLVIADAQDADVRYRQLETVRQYARDRLQETGEEARARERHREFFLALAERAEGELRGPSPDVWLNLLEKEHDNLRAALQWTTGDGAVESGLRLAGALGRFWSIRGYFAEGRRWLEAVVAKGGSTPEAARAKALIWVGTLAQHQSDYAAARSFLEEGLQLFTALGDRHGIARALSNLGNVAHHQGDYAEARSFHIESLEINRALGDKHEVAVSLNNLGILAADQGDYDEALSFYEESLALHRELGDKRGIAVLLGNLGNIALYKGEYDRARQSLVECLALDRELGDRRGTAVVLNNLAYLEEGEGNSARAADLHAESLALRRAVGDRRGIAMSLSGLASIAAGQGAYGRADALYAESLSIYREIMDKRGIAAVLEGLAVASAWRQPEGAARLFGMAAGLRESVGVPLLSSYHAQHHLGIARSRAALGEEAFAAAWAKGKAMTLEQAIKYALKKDS